MFLHVKHLKAEDRAHRHGQKRLVHVYIFCAKDTSDELQWQKLNRSLLCVSSTMNGKHDAIQEIKVEGISYLENAKSTSEKSKQLIEFKKCTANHDLQLARSSCDTHVKSEGKTTSNGVEFVDEVELRAKNSIQSSSLRFEVSQHTGRIHLYSCTSGTNSRPMPLFKNFRQEEVECHPITEENEKTNKKPIEENLLYMEALMEFINEWRELRPIEKRKLINKPLKLPVANELCYLNESLNHDNGGLLRGGSKRRKTPKDEISHPLPPNAAWQKVNLYGGKGRKERVYTQGWSDMNEPLCKLCQIPCKGNNAKVPQFFEDLFCTLDCLEEYSSRTSNRFLREGLFEIEHGICTKCKLNCHQLVKHLKVLSIENRGVYIKKVAPNIAKRDTLLQKLVHDPTEGNAWHADHIIPVYNGGGECKLENMRTLCVACHADVTTAQCSERRAARDKAKKLLKETMKGLINKNSHKVDNVLQDCDLDLNRNELDDELLIEIPGSAYSGANANATKEQNQDQQLSKSSSEHISDSDEAPRIIHSGKLENPSNRSQSTNVNSDEASEVVTDEKESEEHKKLLNSADSTHLNRGEALNVTENGAGDEDKFL
ncbi:DNA helicase [Handroanthus impetiginosus]|uniref:DNA helicase n=1 Tax=Handroanthus impetiginosus TaxID=429701 RepID=A0A2G9HID6_9LAMI|nr:DNA helicase [Handroanthus impetiginosus]